MKRLVQNWESKASFSIYIFVEYQRENWQRRINRRVSEDQITIINWNSYTEKYHCENCLYERYNHTSVNYELGQFGWSLIRHSAMPKYKFFKMTELNQWEISSERSLHTFSSNNTKSNVSFLDHCDIIASVSYTCDILLCVKFNISSNKSLLGWTTSTNTNRFSLASNSEEFLF